MLKISTLHKFNQPAYLADLLVRPNAQNIYAPQIQIALLFLV